MKVESLKKENNFQRVRKTGRFYRGKLMRLSFAEGDGSLKLGIAVSKRVSRKAVERNKIRRRVKAAVEKVALESGLNAGEMVISPAAEAKDVAFGELIEEVKRAGKIVSGGKR